MEGNHRLFAVVTGASSGIGYELARVFAKNGYDLLVTPGSPGAEEAARDFGSLGPNVQSVQADLATHDRGEALRRSRLRDVRSMRSRSTRASASEASSQRPTCTKSSTSSSERHFHRASCEVRGKGYAVAGMGRILLPHRLQGRCRRRSKPCTAPPRRLSFRFRNRCIMNSRTPESRSPRFSRARPTPTSSTAPGWTIPRSVPKASIRTIPLR